MTDDLTAEDRLAIQELVATFYLAIDGGDPAGVAATFVPDGVLVIREGDETSPSSRIAGTAEIEDAMRTYFRESEDPPAKHFVSNFVIRTQAEGARVVFSILNMDIETGPTPIGTASGDCLVRKAGSGWKLVLFDHYVDPAYRQH